SFLLHRAKSFWIYAAADDMALLLHPASEQLRHVFYVVIRYCGDKKCLVEFGSQHRMTVINVMRVNGEAVGNSTQLVGDPGEQRRVSGVMSVNMLHAVQLKTPRRVNRLRK